MKNLILILFAILPLLMFSGCATSTGSSEYTPEALRADVDAAVGTFAAFRLSSHPDGRPAWEAAERGLANLVQHENWSVSAFTEAFALAGADKIQSERIRLVVENGLVIVTAASRGRVNIEDPIYARAVVEGALDAIRRALRSITPIH